MHLRRFIAELCHNLVFCMCLLIMCIHSNNNALAFYVRTADSRSPCSHLSFLSGHSSPSPKPCGTRRACPLRGAWARTGASWLPTAPRLSTPAPRCGRAPDWLWCHPTYRENQKRSSALNSARPQNRHQKTDPTAMTPPSWAIAPTR